MGSIHRRSSEGTHATDGNIDKFRISDGTKLLGRTAGVGHLRAEMSPQAPELTVVVPTRGRPHRLGAALSALARQTLASTMEIIVVDDGSPAPEPVAAVVDQFAGARLVRRAPGGVGAARNTGVREARAALVCFTDDDCETAPDWAAQVKAAFDEGADAVAGLTLNGCPDNPFDETSQLITNLLVARATSDGRTSYGAGSNLSCRTDVLKELPFDERYWGAAEERDWCQRLVDAGYRLAWKPSAKVYHRQQLGWKGFWRKHVHYGRGAYKFRSIAPRRRPLDTPDFYSQLVRAGFGTSWKVGLLMCLSQLATAVGFAREWSGERRDNRLKRAD